MDDNNNNNNKKSAKFSLIQLILTIGLDFFASFVFMKMYNWFIPSITNWNPITYWMAFGVDCVLSVLFGSIVYEIDVIKTATCKQTKEEIIGGIVAKYIVYAFLLGIGALVQLGI